MRALRGVPAEDNSAGQCVNVCLARHPHGGTLAGVKRLKTVVTMLDTRTEALKAGQPWELLAGVSVSITSTPAQEEAK